MVSGSSVYLCPYDGSPCDKFIDDLGLGACHSKRLDDKLRFFCSRFSVSGVFRICLEHGVSRLVGEHKFSVFVKGDDVVLGVEYLIFGGYLRCGYFVIARVEREL